MFEKIKNALIDAGYSEQDALQIAEVLTDNSWADIRDVLNTIY
jgi:uncharacterized protein YdaT